MATSCTATPEKAATSSSGGEQAPALSASTATERKPFASAKRCAPEPYAFSPTGKYRHTRTRLLVQSQGDPKHAVQDSIAPHGADAVVTGKFSYGSAGKDLEGEDVTLFVRSPACKWLRGASSTTDGDGRASFTIGSQLVPDAGAYALEVVVEGDGSKASGTLLVVERGTPAVVFDIDATLTTSDNEIIDEVLNGKIPEMREDAEKVARAYADAGFVVAYVSGRPYLLDGASRKWLDDHGFPEGIVRTTNRLREAAPTEDAVGRYKARVLSELKANGLELKLAYGNAATDICAYKNAGIDPQRTFIVGPLGGQGCAGAAATRALRSYGEHLNDLAQLTQQR